MLKGESGSETVVAAVEEGADISAVNLAEALSKLAEGGVEPAQALRDIEQLGDALVVHQLDRSDLIEIARLRPLTRKLGFSLGDRTCLALATRLEARALTADSAWFDATSIDVDVVLIR